MCKNTLEYIASKNFVITCGMPAKCENYYNIYVKIPDDSALFLLTINQRSRINLESYDRFLGSNKLRTDKVVTEITKIDGIYNFRYVKTL